MRRTSLLGLVGLFVCLNGCSDDGAANALGPERTASGGEPPAANGANDDSGGPAKNGAPPAGTGAPDAGSPGDAGSSPPDAARDGGTEGGSGGGFSYQPVPTGCITNVSAGTRQYTCNGLAVEAEIPTLASTCPAAGCGLILQLHGDTGTGPLIDAHLRLRTRAAARGYIVVAPTGPAIGVAGYPGSTWSPANDAAVVAIVNQFVSVFRVDPKRIHATGFSRGGHMTWRLACDQSNLFASVAPGAAGNASTQLLVNQLEPTCFQNGRNPARAIPILTLMGRTDVPVPYASMVSIKNAALARYGIGAADVTTVASNAQFVHVRSTKVGAPTVEWFDHAYELVPGLTYSSSRGHCIPGSTYSPTAPQYPFACNPNPANAFDWGAEVLAFFERNPMP